MSPARTVGETIRLAREKRGLSRQDVCGETRIANSILEKIEEDRFSELPGELYTRNYIRVLATYLDLDSVDLITLLRSEGATADDRSSTDPNVWREDEVPITRIKTRQPKWWLWLLLALMLITGGLLISRQLGWLHIELGNRGNDGDRAESVTTPVLPSPEDPIPAESSREIEAPADNPVEPVSVPVSEPAVEPDEEMTREPEPMVYQLTTPPVFVDGDNEASPADLVPATIRLELTATGPCRVQVNIDDRRYLARSFDPAGGSWIMEGSEFVILSTSAAENLVLKLNGEDYALPEGNRGRVQACRIDLLGQRTGS